MPDLDLLHPLVADAVRRHGLVVEVLACDPELADTEAFCQAYGIDPQDSVNTIVVAGKAEPPVLVACGVLAVDRLDVNGTVRRRIGTKKASFAPGDLTTERTSMERGGVTVVGLPDAMPVWLDAAVLGRASIVLGGGNRSSKLRLAPTELHKVPGASFVEGLAQPR